MSSTETAGRPVDNENDGQWSQLADAFGLDARPAPARRWVQSPNAGHLSGLVWGTSKPDIVLLHDLGDISNLWDAVTLASRHNVVALDLPGHGRSSAAASIAPPARQAPALIDAIRSLAPTASLTVASGFAAAIALQAALKRPATIGSLLIVDSGSTTSGHGALVDPGGFAELDGAIRRLTEAAPRRNPEFIRHLANESTVVNGGRLEWRYQLGGPPDDYSAWLSVDRFGDPPIPVAIITSTAGQPTDPIARSISEHWPTTRQIVIDGPPDDLIGSAPIAVAHAIDDFFSQLPGGITT